MKAPDSKEPPARVTLTKPAAVDIVCNLNAIRKLEPFMRQEHTLSTAAAAVGVAPSTVAYWIPRFLRAGLLRVVRTEARAGMATTWYRATARSWFVPVSAMGPDARSRFVDAARTKAWERWLESVHRAEENMASAGIAFSVDLDRGVNIEYAPPSGETAGLYELYGVAELTAEEVEDVQRRLTELGEMLLGTVRRPGTTRHRVQFGFVPDRPEPVRRRRRAV